MRFCEILQACRDVPTSGYLGISKTYFRTSQDCYWPGQFRNIVKYVRSCEICQRRKVEQKTPAELIGRKIPSSPWISVSVDRIGPLPSSKKCNLFCLVCQDTFSKWVEAKPLRRATSKVVAEVFHELIIVRWIALRFVIYDNGTQFTSAEFKTSMEELHIKILVSPPYTPQANPVERVNWVLKTMNVGHESYSDRGQCPVFLTRKVIRNVIFCSLRIKQLLIVF